MYICIHSTNCCDSHQQINPPQLPLLSFLTPTFIHSSFFTISRLHRLNSITPHNSTGHDLKIQKSLKFYTIPVCCRSLQDSSFPTSAHALCFIPHLFARFTFLSTLATLSMMSLSAWVSLTPAASADPSQGCCGGEDTCWVTEAGL